jgi:hypothetical protein
VQARPGWRALPEAVGAARRKPDSHRAPTRVATHRGSGKKLIA